MQWQFWGPVELSAAAAELPRRARRCISMRRAQHAQAFLFYTRVHDVAVIPESVPVHHHRPGHRHGGQPQLRLVQHGHRPHQHHRHQRQSSRTDRQNGELIKVFNVFLCLQYSIKRLIKDNVFPGPSQTFHSRCPLSAQPQCLCCFSTHYKRQPLFVPLSQFLSLGNSSNCGINKQQSVDRIQEMKTPGARQKRCAH